MTRVEESPTLTWSQSTWSQSISHPHQPLDSYDSSSVRSAGTGGSNRKIKDRIAMKSIKTTGSDRSAKRVQRHHKSQSADNHFETQHEQMLSRQQFRTNTSRSSNNIVNSGKNVVVINGGDSYGSGFSHISRRSEQVVPPRTIHKNQFDKNETVEKVKLIISGK